MLSLQFIVPAKIYKRSLFPFIPHIMLSVYIYIYIYIYMIHFVNCNWVVTRWQKCSIHLHTNNTQNDTKQTIHRATQQFWKSAGRAPSWLVIPWHLPYNRGKSTEKPRQYKLSTPSTSNSLNFRITVALILQYEILRTPRSQHTRVTPFPPPPRSDRPDITRT